MRPNSAFCPTTPPFKPLSPICVNNNPLRLSQSYSQFYPHKITQFVASRRFHPTSHPALAEHFAPQAFSFKPTLSETRAKTPRPPIPPHAGWGERIREPSPALETPTSKPETVSPTMPDRCEPQISISSSRPSSSPRRPRPPAMPPDCSFCIAIREKPSTGSSATCSNSSPGRRPRFQQLPRHPRAVARQKRAERRSF